MSDIIDRIRDTETMPLSSVAARADVQNILQEAREEITRLRLTDAEREAIRVTADAYAVRGGIDGRESVTAAILRGLLERTKETKQ